MNPILKKLGFTNQNPILIVNAPNEYREVLQEVPAEVHTAVKGKYRFIQIFVRSLAEAGELVNQTLGSLEENGHFWLCYPKGTSKTYKADINRDKAWSVMSPFEFEPVSLVAVDDDWSALRFKHIDSIKELKRKTAATEKGKARIQEKNPQ